MRRIGLAVILTIGLLAMPLDVEAQPGRIYGVGVVHQGGAYIQSVDGLRDGLRELGFEEGFRPSRRPARTTSIAALSCSRPAFT